MRRCVLFLALSGWVGAAAAQPAQPPRVEGEGAAAGATVVLNEIDADAYPEMRLYATVLRDGVPVTGLTAADFRVREDEIDQEPLVVEPELPALSVVVTIDSSGSMARRMDETKVAAKRFVSSLGPRDSVQVVGFARQVRDLTPMISDKRQAEAAIDGLVARGDTALYDALHHSVGLLADRAGRRAIVLLSDGVDDDGTGKPLSARTVDEALSHATTTGVPVFVIGLGVEMDEATLSEIARRSGGQYLSAPDASALDAVYARIGDRLSGQYSIRYRSNLPADGAERRVDLAALGAQDSRAYAPAGGGATVAPPPASASPQAGCAPADALAAERPALEQAQQRYTQNLIGSSDRDHVRDRSVGRIADATRDAAVDVACAGETLDAVSNLYEGNVINAGARDQLRLLVVERLDADCARADRDGQLACLRFAARAYNANDLANDERSRLRDGAFARLLADLVATETFDDAMTLVVTLYNENLLASRHRDEARAALLAAGK